MIVILDYGVGNLTSIKNMIHKAGGNSVISNQNEVISRADKLILPGVGSFDHGITSLKNSSYFELINHMVLHDKVPILGVCLGVQLFTKGSEEGKLPGLGWINASTNRFRLENLNNQFLKIPHMGWNSLTWRLQTVAPGGGELARVARVFGAIAIAWRRWRSRPNCFASRSSMRRPAGS